MAALDEMLGTLKDPATHIADGRNWDNHVIPAIRVQDGITVVRLEPGDWNKSMEVRNTLVNSLRGKGAIVFDLRNDRLAATTIPSSLPPIPRAMRSGRCCSNSTFRPPISRVTRVKL